MEQQLISSGKTEGQSTTVWTFLVPVCQTCKMQLDRVERDRERVVYAASIVAGLVCGGLAAILMQEHRFGGFLFVSVACGAASGTIAAYLTEDWDNRRFARYNAVNKYINFTNADYQQAFNDLNLEDWKKR